MVHLVSVLALRGPDQAMLSLRGDEIRRDTQQKQNPEH